MSEFTDFDFGTLLRGSIVEGLVYPNVNQKVRRIVVPTDNSELISFSLSEHLSDDEDSPCPIPFQLNLTTVGDFFIVVHFYYSPTEYFGLSAHLSVTSSSLEKHQRNVLFCSSPYTTRNIITCTYNLKLMLRELSAVPSAMNHHPTELGSFQKIILTGDALDSLQENGTVQQYRNYLEGGGTLIVLANEFWDGSIPAANNLINRYGIFLQEREYMHVYCNEDNCSDSLLTQGIRKLYFFRPSPITVTGDASLIVSNPESPQEGFVAVSRPHGTLIVVGHSLLESFLCVGWPFDNGQLLANLLAAP